MTTLVTIVESNGERKKFLAFGKKKENRETLYNGRRNIQIRNFLTVFM